MYTQQTCRGMMRRDSNGDLVCSNPGCGNRIKVNSKGYDKRLADKFCGKMILVKLPDEAVRKKFGFVTV